MLYFVVVRRRRCSFENCTISFSIKCLRLSHTLWPSIAWALCVTDIIITFAHWHRRIISINNSCGNRAHTHIYIILDMLLSGRCCTFCFFFVFFHLVQRTPYADVVCASFRGFLSLSSRVIFLFEFRTNILNKKENHSMSHRRRINEMKWSEMCGAHENRFIYRSLKCHMLSLSRVRRATDDNGAHKIWLMSLCTHYRIRSRICRDKVKKQKEKEVKRAQIIT